VADNVPQGPQVRAEVVQALTRPHGLPADRADALLDASAAERALASRVLLDQAAEVLAEAGVIRPGRTVLDCTLREASSLAAALGRLAGWWPQPSLEHRPLGDVLKVVPADEAAAVVDLLVWGGWLGAQPSTAQEGGSKA
jgi:hypothetical protein